MGNTMAEKRRYGDTSDGRLDQMETEYDERLADIVAKRGAHVARMVVVKDDALAPFAEAHAYVEGIVSSTATHAPNETKKKCGDLSKSGMVALAHFDDLADKLGRMTSEANEVEFNLRQVREEKAGRRQGNLFQIDRARETATQ